MRTRHSRIALAIAVSIASGTAHAAFFQLAENSAAGLGNAFAGGAAVAEDASVVWYNPAGMSKLQGTQLVVVGHYIAPSLEFSKTSANLATALGGGAISGGDGGDAGEAAVVPNVYFAMPLGERLHFGIGINAPFGLATDYDDDWVGRYHANRSEIMTINVNPALSYRVNDTFSVGVGISYQKLEATLTQAIDYGSLCALAGATACAAPGANDGSARVEADDDAWGYNLGLRWQATPDTGIGVAYRSKLKYALKGDSDVSAPSTLAATAGAAVAGIVDAAVSADITLPATLSISLEQRLGKQWQLLADITRTYWSDLPELRIDFDSTQPDSVVTLGLRNVNRYAIGASYRPTDQWVVRAGIALDETPTPNAELRAARLPDENRTWYSLGFGYAPSTSFSFDVGLTYIKNDEAEINKSAGAPGSEDFLRGSLVGRYDSSTTILSGQLKWLF